MSRKARQPSLFATAPRACRIGEAEADCRRRGEWPVIGTDEVGRGPLAGPVVAAAVMLEEGARLPGLNDSKRLTPARREALEPIIRARSVVAAVVEGPVALIDELNILHASLWAMRQAVAACLAELEAAGGPRPRVLLVDGNRPVPGIAKPTQRALVQGDRRSRAIAAASVLAKVHRDRLMVALDADFPGYGLAQHKGYPTRMHLAALRELGPTPHHRRSFAPVAAALRARS